MKHMTLPADLIERSERILDEWRAAQVKPQAEALSRTRLAGMIDHTALKAETTWAQLTQLCEEAREYGFASVCVNSANVAYCSAKLQGSGVPVCSVVGFPLGACLTSVKVSEAKAAIEAGATEIDMVIQIGALKHGNYQLVGDDIAAVVDACHAAGAICKVIIEAALLSDLEKVLVCLLIKTVGGDFCKTSTGFGPGGATLDDVALMRATVGPQMGVKAAGGIRTYEDACAMVAAGATRVGASAGVKIVTSAFG